MIFLWLCIEFDLLFASQKGEPPEKRCKNREIIRSFQIMKQLFSSHLDLFKTLKIKIIKQIEDVLTVN